MVSLADPVVMGATLVIALVIALVMMQFSGNKSAGGEAFDEVATPKKTKAELKKEAQAAAENQAAKKRAKKAAQKAKKKTASSDVLGNFEDAEDKKEQKKKKKKSSKKPKGGDGGGQSQPKAKKASQSAAIELNQGDIDDGWAIAGAAKPKAAEASSPSRRPKMTAAKKKAAAEAALIPESGGSIQMTVDGRKLGLIIGPGGETIKKLQDTTGASLQLPDRKGGEEGERDEGPCTLTISGEKPQIAALKKAISDLCSKGYSTATEGANFSEAAIQCKSDKLFELIGPGGVVIKALQEKLNVRINTPDTKGRNDLREKAQNLRVGIAGEKANVDKAKKIMKEILRYHHHDLTHPGVVHEEMSVPPSQYSLLIGPRGSTIKDIQGTNNVKVHIPNPDTYVQNVMLVGAKADVTRAKKHCEKIIANALARQEARAEAANQRWEQSQEWQEDDEDYESWMDDYAPPPKSAGWSGASW